MSKKVRLSLLAGLFLLVGGGASFASEVPDPIPLTVGYDEPVPSIPGLGKGPGDAPIVMLEVYELSFQSLHPAYTLYILEDDVVVYSDIVSSSTMSVMLPSWLCGEYELQLYPDGSSYYFYGFIYL